MTCSIFTIPQTGAGPDWHRTTATVYRSERRRQQSIPGDAKWRPCDLQPTRGGFRYSQGGCCQFRHSPNVNTRRINRVRLARLNSRRASASASCRHRTWSARLASTNGKVSGGRVR